MASTTDTQVERKLAEQKAAADKAAADKAAKDAADAAAAAAAAAAAKAAAQTTADPMLVSITEAMVKAHPELATVRDLYLQGKYAEAINTLYSTNFYKTTSATVFANETTKINQPGVYENTIKNEWLPALRQEAIAKGLKVSDASLEAIARKAYDLGLTTSSPATLELFRGTDSTGNAYVTTIQGGLASSTKSNLAAANDNYGSGYNQDWLTQAATSVAEGSTTEQYWTDQIKSQAAGAFPAWSNQINAGLTMKQIASPYIQTYANILGVDPAGITLNDNLLKQGLQGTDPTSPSGLSMWQFEKLVRQDPRWAQSKDAMDSLSSTGASLLRQWGLMS